MYERLVENWLTSVNELGYQLPFCEVLVSEGYTILHVSRHGRGEHGKDIVARAASGELCTFQLKGGDVSLPAWRQIRGEVEELVQLPVRVPGVDEGERHVPHLVTNGEIRGDALESIKQYSDTWERQGYPALQTWGRGVVFKKFLDAQGTFFPTAIGRFRDFVDLYAGPFDGTLPRGKLAALIESISGAETEGLTPIRQRRALAAVSLIASYIIEQYAAAGNHLASAAGWVIVAASIMRVIERERLGMEVYDPVLSLAWVGFERGLQAFADEALSSDDFVMPRALITEPMLYGVRVAMILGWLAIWTLDRRWRRGLDVDTTRLFEVMRRESRAIDWTGESDWPLQLAIILLLEREHHAREADSLLASGASRLIRVALQSDPSDPSSPGNPSPYWLPEQVIRRRYGLLPPAESEYFGHTVYTLSQRLDMLVRRLCRQAIAAVWPDATRLIFADYIVNTASEVFRWRTDAGELREVAPAWTRSWSEWRQEVGAVDTREVPQVLVRHSEWLLPFLAIYPHRATRTMTALADALVGRRARTGVDSSNDTEPSP